jgi:hypothetical protein
LIKKTTENEYANEGYKLGQEEELSKRLKNLGGLALGFVCNNAITEPSFPIEYVSSVESYTHTNPFL